MSEVIQAVVNYRQICDKKGFCVVKIISQNPETPTTSTPITPTTPVPIEQKITKPEKVTEQKAPIKFSSSRKNKKK
jgi:hypothetical protein